MSRLDKEFLVNLQKYISFKTISTDKKYLGEIEKCVFWLKTFIEENGGEVELLQQGTTNPVIVANFKANIPDAKKIKTILVYGHYDVQTGEKTDGWQTSDPFIIEKKKWRGHERLVARGIVDNKAQNFIHLFTVAKLFRQNKLAYNVKFVLEGNEESGNDDLPKILRKYKAKFSAGLALVSDGEIVKNFPVMESSLRGGANILLQIKTAKNSLHSGIFGGAAPSAAQVAAALISKLKDEKNKVLVPGFYDGVIWPSKEVLENNRKLGNKKVSITLAGTKDLLTLSRYDFFTQTGCLPALEVSGIKTGYTESGFANIIPATAEIKINLRFSRGQSSEKTIKKVFYFIKKNIPKYAEYKIIFENHGDAVVLDTESEWAKSISSILEKVYEKKVLNKFVGGSIPILGDFQKILGVKVLSVSLGNDDCNMHGVDENFKTDLVKKGLEFSETFFGGKTK